MALTPWKTSSIQRLKLEIMICTQEAVRWRRLLLQSGAHVRSRDRPAAGSWEGRRWRRRFPCVTQPVAASPRLRALVFSRTCMCARSQPPLSFCWAMTATGGFPFRAAAPDAAADPAYVGFVHLHHAQKHQFPFPSAHGMHDLALIVQAVATAMLSCRPNSAEERGFLVVASR